ncbi:MAG: hypothetical protein R2729_07085 [Bryobacteraceae bacterium]
MYTLTGVASMAASATPKQGDHVFNAVDTAILRPYETFASLQSPLANGRLFLQDYLLNSYSFTRDLATRSVLREARRYVATASDEDTVRELAKLRSWPPVLARVTPELLRGIHRTNADRFGAAAAGYEAEVLLAIQMAIENASFSPPAGRTRVPRGPGLAFQHMLSTAYDPAAALTVIVNLMTREPSGIQPNFRSVVVRIVETLDRPGMWREPYAEFREDRPTPTGEAVSAIGKVLLRMEALKPQSILIKKWIADEIAQKADSGAETVFGPMLHLLHTRLQQMKPTVAS